MLVAEVNNQNDRIIIQQFKEEPRKITNNLESKSSYSKEEKLKVNPQNYSKEKVLEEQQIQSQIINERADIQKQKKQLNLFKEKLKLEQLKLAKQKKQLEQRQIQQEKKQKIIQKELQQRQKMYNQKDKQEKQKLNVSQLQERQRLDKIKSSNQALAKRNAKDKKQTFFQYKGTFQPEQQFQRVLNSGQLLEGEVFEQRFDKWQKVRACLTPQTFLGFNTENISKLKVRYSSHIPHTRMMKLSVNGKGDVFVAVPMQDQAEWMARIVQAHLMRTGRKCNQNQQFYSFYEGQIIRKSFFKGWETKFGSISANGLSMNNGIGGSVTHKITSVPQIWTRFDIVHGNMLILKFHSSGRKNEIGIPIEHAIPWLQGLYTLIRPS